jgi:hypothetical protein
MERIRSGLPIPRWASAVADLTTSGGCPDVAADESGPR